MGNFDGLRNALSPCRISEVGKFNRLPIPKVVRKRWEVDGSQAELNISRFGRCIIINSVPEDALGIAYDEVYQATLRARGDLSLPTEVAEHLDLWLGARLRLVDLWRPVLFVPLAEQITGITAVRDATSNNFMRQYLDLKLGEINEQPNR